MVYGIWLKKHKPTKFALFDQVKMKIKTDIVTTKVYKPHWIVLFLWVDPEYQISVS